MDPVMYSSESGDWETPSSVFRWANRRWGPFELDAAADGGNALAPVFCSPIGSFKDGVSTGPEDGLSANWAKLARNGPVWVNPPYGRGVEAWVDKMIHERDEHRARVVALLPARTDTKWFFKAWSAAEEVVFIQGRLKFLRDGETLYPAPFPSVLIYFDGTQALRLLGPRAMYLGQDD